MLHLTGCTAFRPVAIPGSNFPPESEEQEFRELNVGDPVRITVHSGKILTGKIERISPKEITIGTNGNRGYEQTTVRLAEVSSLEVEGVGGPLELLGGAASIAGVFVGTIILLIVVTGARPAGN